MRRHEALVDDADVDPGVARVARGPGLGGAAAVLVGRRARVAIHAPQRAVREQRVVRRGGVLVGPVRFGEAHGGVRAEALESALHRDHRRHAHERDVAGQALGGLATHAGEGGLALRRRRRRRELHDHFTGQVRLAAREVVAHEVGPAGGLRARGNGQQHCDSCGLAAAADLKRH